MENNSPNIVIGGDAAILMDLVQKLETPDAKQRHVVE